MSQQSFAPKRTPPKWKDFIKVVMDEKPIFVNLALWEEGNLSVQVRTQINGEWKNIGRQQILRPGNTYRATEWLK